MICHQHKKEIKPIRCKVIRLDIRDLGIMLHNLKILKNREIICDQNKKETKPIYGRVIY